MTTRVELSKQALSYGLPQEQIVRMTQHALSVWIKAHAPKQKSNPVTHSNPPRSGYGTQSIPYHSTPTRDIPNPLTDNRVDIRRGTPSHITSPPVSQPTHLPPTYSSLAPPLLTNLSLTNMSQEPMSHTVMSHTPLPRTHPDHAFGASSNPTVLHLAAPHVAIAHPDAPPMDMEVDVSHLQRDYAPSESKFKRFEFLLQVHRTILDDLQHNVGLIRNSNIVLDQDTQQLFHDDCQLLRKDLALIRQEMHEIRLWFQDVRSEKEALYGYLRQHTRDRHGRMQTHFTQKQEQMAKCIAYIEEMMPVGME